MMACDCGGSGQRGEYKRDPDTKKSKHYKPKVLARQPNNYGYGRALGYAEGFGYRPRGPVLRRGICGRCSRRRSTRPIVMTFFQ